MSVFELGLNGKWVGITVDGDKGGQRSNSFQGVVTDSFIRIILVQVLILADKIRRFLQDPISQ